MAFRRRTVTSTVQATGPSLGAVVPLVRADLNLEAQPRDQRPVPVLADGDPSTPVVEAFVGSLLVMYAFDLPERFQMVAYRDLAALGVTREVLAASGRANLVPRLGELKFQQGSRGFGMIRLDGNLEASMLLVAEPWRQMASRVRGELLVAVPARDVVLYCDSANGDAVAALCASRDEVFAGGDHTITRDILRWDDPTWCVEVR